MRKTHHAIPSATRHPVKHPHCSEKQRSDSPPTPTIFTQSTSIFMPFGQLQMQSWSLVHPYALRCNFITQSGLVAIAVS